jgi:hypothetical protein
MDSSVSLVVSGMLDLWIAISGHHGLCRCQQGIDGTLPELFRLMLICLISHVITLFYFLNRVPGKHSLNV